MKTVIVDVDSILWDFVTPMKAKMREMYPHKDIPEEFDSWTHPEEIFDNFEEMMGCFTSIHEAQEQYKPFDGAVELLQSLKQKGYRIHIASNRPAHTRQFLVNWLNDYGLYYHEVFAAEDKSVLFSDDTIVMVIDDRPSTQEDCLKRGFKVLTLDYKYNRDVTGTVAFTDLNRMNMYLLNQIQDAI